MWFTICCSIAFCSARKLVFSRWHLINIGATPADFPSPFQTIPLWSDWPVLLAKFMGTDFNVFVFFYSVPPFVHMSRMASLHKWVTVNSTGLAWKFYLSNGIQFHRYTAPFSDPSKISSLAPLGCHWHGALVQREFFFLIFCVLFVLVPFTQLWLSSGWVAGKVLYVGSDFVLWVVKHRIEKHKS